VETLASCQKYPLHYNRELHRNVLGWHPSSTKQIWLTLF